MKKIMINIFKNNTFIKIFQMQKKIQKRKIFLCIRTKFPFGPSLKYLLGFILT